MDRVGRVLNDKWRLDKLVGVGGVAAVYASTHRNGSRVVLKVLHPQYKHAADVRRRFIREGYLANSVNHPGAVAILDDNVSEDGDAFLVMELLEGTSLLKLIKHRGGTLECAQTLMIADGILDVLAAAHSRGIVHRDVKPANAFVTISGRVKILDFGLARLAQGADSSSTEVGVVLGTLQYMAPEQARPNWRPVDGRTDVFGVGAVMFRALAGRAIHAAKGIENLFLAARDQPAPPLGSIVEGIPAKVAEVVDRAVAFDMDDRWPDARAMQSAVRNALYAFKTWPTKAPVAPVLKVPRPPLPSTQSIAMPKTPAPPDEDPPSLLGVDDIETSPPDLAQLVEEMSVCVLDEVLCASDIISEGPTEDDDISWT
jgi:serine/threonine-protein kinase